MYVEINRKQTKVPNSNLEGHRNIIIRINEVGTSMAQKLGFGTKHLAFGTKFLIFGTRCLVLGTILRFLVQTVLIFRKKV